MAKDFGARFRIKPGDRVQLAKRDPADVSSFGSKSVTKSKTDKHAEAINTLQDRLYAEGTRSLLVVLQGIDTAGKDGTIRVVFNHTGPLGVQVRAFKRPSDEELSHDFLWRAHMACPPRGYIGIFNRSHYEDILIGRVRNLAPREEVDRRYDQINDFEKMLTDRKSTRLNSSH